MEKSFVVLSNNQTLRTYSKKDEKNILFNAEPISDFIVFDAELILPTLSYNWIAKEDTEILVGWFANQYLGDSVDPSTQINVNINSESSLTIFSLIREFSQLESFGSASYWEFPKGSLIRQGWTIQIIANNPFNSILIVGKNCNISVSENSKTIPVNPTP